MYCGLNLITKHWHDKTSLLNKTFFKREWIPSVAVEPATFTMRPHVHFSFVFCFFFCLFLFSVLFLRSVSTTLLVIMYARLLNIHYHKAGRNCYFCSTTRAHIKQAREGEGGEGAWKRGRGLKLNIIYNTYRASSKFKSRANSLPTYL